LAAGLSNNQGLRVFERFFSGFATKLRDLWAALGMFSFLLLLGLPLLLMARRQRWLSQVDEG
jgi:hypothetical protein